MGFIFGFVCGALVSAIVSVFVYRNNKEKYLATLNVASTAADKVVAATEKK